MTPRCCGIDAEWIVNGSNLQYWFCRECKKEVADSSPSPHVPSWVKDLELYIDSDGNSLSYVKQSFSINDLDLMNGFEEFHNDYEDER